MALPPGEGGMAAKDVGTWENFQEKYKKEQEDDQLIPYTKALDYQTWYDQKG